MDRANNALASTYTHATTVALDTFDPTIAFPTAGPRVGSASTITLVDSHRPATGKVAKYGAIVVDATATDASGCDTAAKVGNANLTTLATPASPVSFRYTPPSGSAGKKVCAYVEDTAGNSHAALWTTAIVAATAPPAGAIWSATLTVKNRGSQYGCGTFILGGLCSDMSVLTDDDFTYAGTDYTISWLRWLSDTNTLDIGFGIAGSTAKTAFSALRLNVGSNAFAFRDASTSGTFANVTWPFDPATDWAVGDTISVSLSAAPAVTAPAAPTGLTAAKDGAGAIDLSWTAPATASGRAAVTGYEIEWSADGSTGWTDLVIISPASATTYKDSGLAASTTRHYRVRALSSAGAGAWSSTASATTDASGITIEFPSTGPRTGGTYTITLKAPTTKILHYGAIAVPGTETDASACDHGNKILRKAGFDGTTRPAIATVRPPRAEVSFDYPTPVELEGMKACVYAYNGARVTSDSMDELRVRRHVVLP